MRKSAPSSRNRRPAVLTTMPSAPRVDYPVIDGYRRARAVALIGLNAVADRGEIGDEILAILRRQAEIEGAVEDDGCRNNDGKRSRNRQQRGWL